jgi:hypothetical protein
MRLMRPKEWSRGGGGGGPSEGKVAACMTSGRGTILRGVNEKKGAIDGIYVRTMCACSCRFNEDEREPKRLGERASLSEMTDSEGSLSRMTEGSLKEISEGP